MSQNPEQQRDTNAPQSAKRPSSPTGAAAPTANAASTPQDTRTDASTGRGDQERAIQTEREGTRKAGVSPRAPTMPAFGPSAGLATPFAMMRRMADDMDRLFENFGMGSAGFGMSPLLGAGLERGPWSNGGRAVERAWNPQIETFRRGDKLVVRADLPGLTKDDVKVEIDNGILSISGERREQHEEDRDGFYRSERSYGQFYRALPVPDGVSDGECEATFKDGVLEVILPTPKEEQRKGKQIPIH